MKSSSPARSGDTRDRVHHRQRRCTAPRATYDAQLELTPLETSQLYLTLKHARNTRNALARLIAYLEKEQHDGTP